MVQMLVGQLTFSYDLLHNPLIQALHLDCFVTARALQRRFRGCEHTASAVHAKEVEPNRDECSPAKQSGRSWQKFDAPESVGGVS